MGGMQAAEKLERKHKGKVRTNIFSESELSNNDFYCCVAILPHENQTLRQHNPFQTFNGNISKHPQTYLHRNKYTTQVLKCRLGGSVETKASQTIEKR